MSTAKCIYCGSVMEDHKISAKKKIDVKIVTVNETPVHYCRKCDETFLSVDAIKVFTYIKDMGLSHNKMLFNFDEIISKTKKYE